MLNGVELDGVELVFGRILLVLSRHPHVSSGKCRVSKWIAPTPAGPVRHLHHPFISFSGKKIGDIDHLVGTGRS
ncbi:hypothetical protein D3C71_2122260 [compost metagenome]